MKYKRSSITHITIVSGEPSGDAYAAQLINALNKKKQDTFRITGMGGPKSQQAGMECLVDHRALSVMGLIEVIKHLGPIRRAYRALCKHLTNQHPDLLVLIDYPSFNLKLARYAKKKGITVLYYIPPKAWAWKPWRRHALKRYTDHVAVLLPFEVPFFQQAHIPVSQVHHPLLDSLAQQPPRQTLIQRWQLNPKDKIITLLPGSRSMEWRCMLPILIKSACLLKKDWPNVQFLLPLSKASEHKAIERIIQPYPITVHVLPDEAQAALSISDLALAVSGTVTLEAALLHIPMVIVYRVHPITYWCVKPFIRVPYIGLCNLIANKPLVPELIQSQATPELIAAHAHGLIEPTYERQHMIDRLTQMRKQLKPTKQLPRIDEIVLSLLANRSEH
jgi:lipid-A-disaccharide synthase